MNNLKVTIKADNGKECSIENIGTFQKYLQLFYKIRGIPSVTRTDTISRWTTPYLRKIDTIVSEQFG